MSGATYKRRVHRVPEEQTCSRCRNTIGSNAAHYRDLSSAVAHPSCVRLNIKPIVEAPRFKQDPAVGQDCEGCGMKILAGDKVVHVLTRPWHRECRLRR